MRQMPNVAARLRLAPLKLDLLRLEKFNQVRVGARYASPLPYPIIFLFFLIYRPT